MKTAFIDYLPLLLVNMSAALIMVAMYWLRGLDRDRRFYASGFAATGLVAFIFGLHMCFTWPLPGSFNVLFGEFTVILGTLLLGAALAVGKDWNMLAVGIYGFVGGAAAILAGARILNLGLTAAPAISATGFILTGLGGVLSLPIALRPSFKTLRVLGCLALLAAAALWLFTGAMGYWGHLASFAKWPGMARPLE